jgi:hypothetical protein
MLCSMEKQDLAVTRDSDKFMLRLPDGLRERIAAAAKSSQRSMNAEIVARIVASLDNQGGLALQDAEIDAIAKKLAAKVVAALKPRK